MATRVLAPLIVAVVFVYHVLRVMASGCTGGACDWYIPFSLFLPIIAILLAVVTAALAAYELRSRKVWSAIIGICGIVASVGSIVAALAISDNDTKVSVATVLVMTVPASLVTYAVTHRTTIS